QASTWVTASSATAPRYEKISTVPGVSPPRSAASCTAHRDASGVNAHSRSAAAAAASAVIAAVPSPESGWTRGPGRAAPGPGPAEPGGAGTGRAISRSGRPAACPRPRPARHVPPPRRRGLDLAGDREQEKLGARTPHELDRGG